jgi:RHS repeat-associated protein
LKNGKIEHRYLWGAMQDELLAMDDDWTLRDHLNTVRKVMNAKGKVISNLEYNAFGRLISTTGEKPLFRYTGKMFDDATGLQWNINRWYDANVGRWISEDPIGFEAEDANLCRYVFNALTTQTDPFGEVPPVIIGTIGGCAAGALVSGVRAWWNRDQDVCVFVKQPVVASQAG